MMNLFSKKLQCEQCDKKFVSYEELVDHARHQHHHAIVKCDNCGKEFIHEKDRLHHSREEHQKKWKDVFIKVNTNTKTNLQLHKMRLMPI